MDGYGCHFGMEPFGRREATARLQPSIRSERSKGPNGGFGPFVGMRVERAEEMEEPLRGKAVCPLHIARLESDRNLVIPFTSNWTTTVLAMVPGISEKLWANNGAQ